MKNKQKTRKAPSLQAPQGIRVREHYVGADVRYTVRNGSFEKLVGIARKGNFTWIHPSFSA